MSAFDGLAVVEAALGLGRIEACMPPHVPVPRPGPCKGAKRAVKKAAEAVAGPKPAKKTVAKKTAKAAMPKKAAAAAAGSGAPVVTVPGMPGIRHVSWVFNPDASKDPRFHDQARREAFAVGEQRARFLAGFAAEVTERQDGGATSRDLGRLRSSLTGQAARIGLDGDPDVQELIAVMTRDATAQELDAALRAVEAKFAMVRQGAPGERVAYDPRQHRKLDPGERMSTGQQVEVTDPGYDVVYGDELLRVLPVTVDTASGPAPARATPPPPPAPAAPAVEDPEQAEYVGPRFELNDEDKRLLDRYTAAKKISDVISWDDDGTTMDEYVDAQQDTEEAFFALPAPLQRRVRQEEFITSEFEQWRTGKSRPPGAATMRASQVKQLNGLFKGKQIAIRTTPLALGKILDDGRFKTQHETGAGGAVAAYIPQRRAELEAQVWGIPERGFPPERRPVYGYVAVNGITPAGGDTGLDQHGSVQVVLKPQVRARTTAMVGDSYDQRTLARPSPVNDPQWWSYNTRQSQDSAAKHVAGDFFKNWSYVEAQIHDGVSVGDIAEVVLPSAPSAALRKQLEAKGVPWRVLPASS